MAADLPLRETLDLEPRPSSAGEGRRFVRLTLSGWHCPEDAIDLAVLAAAELLSNAILHAGTPLRLEVGLLDGAVRVAVRDYSPAQPAMREHQADSITGRGLGLVSAVSRSWGVESHPDGKAVWAEVDGVGHTDDGADHGDPMTADQADESGLHLRLVGVPVAAFVAMQAQHEAVLRELELTALEAASAGDGSTPTDEIVELARRVAGPRDAVRRAFIAVEHAGLAMGDVDVDMKDADVRAMREWATAMTDADELCRSGRLLSPPATDEVAAVRRLLLTQLEAHLQATGRPARAGAGDREPARAGPGRAGQGERDRAAGPSAPGPGGDGRLGPDEYRRAFDTATVGMAITDLDGRFLSVNAALCQLLGRTEADLLTRTVAGISELSPTAPGSTSPVTAAPGEGQRATIQVERRYRGAGRATVWGLTTSRLLLGEAGSADRVLVEVVDVTAPRVIGELRQSLARARLNMDRVVQAVIDAAVALSGAELGAYYDIGEQGQASPRSATSPAAAAALEKVRVGHSPARLGQMLHAGRAVRLPDVAAGPRYPRAGGPGAGGPGAGGGGGGGDGIGGDGGGRPGDEQFLRSYLGVPVRSGSGDVIGGVVVGHREAGRFDARHERLIDGIAAEAAVTIDNARLYRVAENERRAAQASAERLVRLQAATARLSNVRTMADVGTVLLDELTASVGAARSALWAFSQDAGTLELVGDVNWPADMRARFGRFRLDDPTPAGQAIRTGRPVTIGSLAERGGFPELGDVVTPVRLSYTLPLAIDGRPIGVVTFGWVDRRALDNEQARFITAIGSQCAQALDRALLYQAEQRAVHHQQFLAEASRALAASLDFDTTVERVARLAVPELADTATVLVIEHDEVRPVAHAATNPVKERLLRAVSERLTATDNDWLLHVARTGEAAVRRIVEQPQLDAAALDDEHRRHLAALEFRSLMAVPLVARGDTVGLLALVMTADSGRRYQRSDVEIVRDLADRAAIAIDNARTFQLRNEVAETLQQSLLPPRLPSIPGTDLATRYQPAARGIDVGGDFYDVFETRGGWVLALGDVCGKGAGAAALTAMVRYSLRRPPSRAAARPPSSIGSTTPSCASPTTSVSARLSTPGWSRRPTASG